MASGRPRESRSRPPIIHPCVTGLLRYPISPVLTAARTPHIELLSAPLMR